MAFKRVTIDMAFPMPLSTETQARLNAFLDAAKRLRPHARKINVGLASEEFTVRATHHICHHDEVPAGKCEPDIEI